ncbi:transcription factor GTE9-like [Curcuma longa]|uniref:transcription factor GTE9-like n=1 Tax=Curcuma longa TaxID=136217 RepID=UPI003D9F0078
MMRTVSNRIDCMAPTVLMEYTKEKQRKRCSQDLSFSLKEKSHKLSQGYEPLASLPDYQHDSEKMHDSEDVGSFVRAQSDDSSSAKRQKCISVNLDGSEGFNIPLQQIPYLKMSGSQRKKLKMRLRSELNQLQLLQKRFFLSAETVGVITSSSVNESEKEVDPKSVTQLKRATSGKSEFSKMTVPPPPVDISSLALMKQCEGLLKRLMSHRFAWVFNIPVDVKKLNIPDYHTVIKNPMDLGTIKTKISSGGYSSPWDFAADVRLTFTNAMTYNPPTNDVHLMADSLSKYFELRWKPIEKKLAAADAYVKKEIQVPKPVVSSQARKNLSKPEVCSRKKKKSHIECIGTVSQKVMCQMSKEEKLRLASNLESHLDDLPDHIFDFLRQQSNMNDSSGEIEIDIESLGDDTLFKLQDLLDKYFQEREMRQLVKFEQCQMEVSENALSTSVMHQFKDNNPAEEDVDIGGDDPPIPNYPTLDIRKDTKSRETKCGSSSSYTSDSGSSTDSDSSNGSELKKFSIPKDDAKENSANKAGSDQEKSDLMNPFDMTRPLSEFNCSEKTADAKSALVDSERCQEGEHAPSEKNLSPEKQYRVALLRNRFADTILKAKEKTLGQGAKGDPEKLQRAREEIKRQQKEDRARLQAEAKAAEEARRRAEAEAAAEAKRQRELEREAARQALSKIEKTVEINDCRILKDLEMLGTATAEEMPISDKENNSGYSLDDIGGFKLGGGNPLEQLGLFMKADDEEEEECENMPLHDAEEGEIE